MPHINAIYWDGRMATSVDWTLTQVLPAASIYLSYEVCGLLNGSRWRHVTSCIMIQSVEALSASPQAVTRGSLLWGSAFKTLGWDLWGAFWAWHYISMSLEAQQTCPRSLSLFNFTISNFLCVSLQQRPVVSRLMVNRYHSYLLWLLHLHLLFIHARWTLKTPKPTSSRSYLCSKQWMRTVSLTSSLPLSFLFFSLERETMSDRMTEKYPVKRIHSHSRTCRSQYSFQTAGST